MENFTVSAWRGRPAAAGPRGLAGSATRSLRRGTTRARSAGTQEKHRGVVEMLIRGRKKKKKSYDKSQ